MADDDRARRIRSVLFEHFRINSNSQLRNAFAISRVGDEILECLKPDRSIWVKWSDEREKIVKAAQLCWIPLEDLQAYLNAMPGPELTRTDVAQRLRAFHEEDYIGSYPNEALKEGCLQVYAGEKAHGTEMIAIIGALQDHVEREEHRLWQEQQANWKQQREAERVALEARLLSGADCKWTALNKSRELFSRLNGRLYRLAPNKDKSWTLTRISVVEEKPGVVIGVYKSRGDANKVMATVAYQPDFIR